MESLVSMPSLCSTPATMPPSFPPMPCTCTPLPARLPSPSKDGCWIALAVAAYRSVRLLLPMLLARLLPAPRSFCGGRSFCTRYMLRLDCAYLTRRYRSLFCVRSGISLPSSSFCPPRVALVRGSLFGFSHRHFILLGGGWRCAAIGGAGGALAPCGPSLLIPSCCRYAPLAPSRSAHTSADLAWVIAARSAGAMQRQHHWNFVTPHATERYCWWWRLRNFLEPCGFAVRCGGARSCHACWIHSGYAAGLACNLRFHLRLSLVCSALRLLHMQLHICYYSLQLPSAGYNGFSGYSRYGRRKRRRRYWFIASRCLCLPTLHTAAHTYLRTHLHTRYTLPTCHTLHLHLEVGGGPLPTFLLGGRCPHHAFLECMPAYILASLKTSHCSL